MNQIQSSHHSSIEHDFIRNKLLEKKAELTTRLDQIDITIHTPLDPDSSEQAVELENREVLNYLCTEAQAELSQVNEALWRLENNCYGSCSQCRQTIPYERLRVYPYADKCIACEEKT